MCSIGPLLSHVYRYVINSGLHMLVMLQCTHNSDQHIHRVSARGGPGGVRTPHSAPQGVISPPCWQENFKKNPYFTVVSVKIGHFEHQNLKTLDFFLLGEYPPDPPPVLDPPSQTFLAGTMNYMFTCQSLACHPVTKTQNRPFSDI